MKKFAIGIPTLNRADLLIPSLIKYVQDFNGVEIHIIDNGDQDLEKYEKYDNIFVHTQHKNIGVAASWNMLCDIIYAKHEWALLLNDDVYLGYYADTINQVIDDNNTFGLIQSHLNFSVILLQKEFFEFVGRFDENFLLYKLKYTHHAILVVYKFHQFYKYLRNLIRMYYTLHENYP
jgi:GT2 family glycosyltransferase